MNTRRRVNMSRILLNRRMFRGSALEPFLQGPMAVAPPTDRKLSSILDGLARCGSSLGRLLPPQDPYMPKPSLELVKRQKPKPALTAKPSPTVISGTMATTIVQRKQTLTLAQLLDERQTVAAKFSQFEARKKAIDAELARIIAKKTGRPDGIADVGDYLVPMVPGTNSTIDRVLLAKLGVKASIIAKATKTTKYYYPRIAKKKADAAGVEDEEL